MTKNVQAKEQIAYFYILKKYMYVCFTNCMKHVVVLVVCVYVWGVGRRVSEERKKCRLLFSGIQWWVF